MWKSKGQTSIATAVGISETIAASEASKLIAHVRNLLADMRFPQTQPTNLYVDSKSTVDAADALAASPRLKHVAISDLYVREMQSRNVLTVNSIAGTDNPSDFFTKPLVGDAFKIHRRTILNLGDGNFDIAKLERRTRVKGALLTLNLLI